MPTFKLFRYWCSTFFQTHIAE